MKKIKLKYIFIIILIVLFGFLIYSIKNIYDSLSNNNEVKTLMTIDKYDYTLNENDSPYFKELFKELKDTLESENVDEEEYASLVSKLFITDFYSLEYAISKSDVGGIEFIYHDYISSFTNKAKDTIYAYVKSNVYGKRKQELPNVSNVEIKNIENKEYKSKLKYNDKLVEDENAYLIDVTITYEKELDYPKEASLVLVHTNDKLEIVKMD